ncbi:MAG: hypothetical protein KO206_09320 [Methanomicrobiaceae archaeon]|nr:hypothetical protein [Methanomicrobiaceae archaeon]MDD5419405.1 hypothetical protein [Methanomicrobiaceae archaeon]
MDIKALIEEIASQSTFQGTYTFEEMTRYAAAHPVHGVGVSRSDSGTFALIFAGGDAEGAIYADDKGVLFGDKAVYQLREMEEFQLYRVAPDIVDALIARSRVYEKGHLKKNSSMDIPAIGGGAQLRPGVLCLTVKECEVPRAGMSVSIRKGKHVLATETTLGDGKVYFKLLSGQYTCVIMDRGREITRFMFDFNARHVESTVDIGSA